MHTMPKITIISIDNDQQSLTVEHHDTGVPARQCKADTRALGRKLLPNGVQEGGIQTVPMPTDVNPPEEQSEADTEVG
jgi:hypothetical protein